MSRARTVLAALVLGGLLLLASAPVWVRGRLADPLGGTALAVEATGAAGAPAVPALALVALAAAVALSTVRGVLLRVTAALLAVAGAGALAATAALLLSPAAALSGGAREVAGTTGTAVTGVVASPWPWLALAPAGALVAVGAWALLAGGRWRTTARFEPPQAAPPAPVPVPDDDRARRAEASRLWDGLSRGEDPTGPARG